MQEKVVVLGGGNGALAFAAYLSLRGEHVCLWEFPEFRDRLKWVYQNNRILATGMIQGEAGVKCYEDLKDALQGVRIVMAVLPAFAHRRLAQDIAPFLEEDSVLVLNPGRTGGALEVASVLGSRVKSVSVVEAQTLLFACRRKGEKAVHLNGIKDFVRVGVFPANRTERVMMVLSEVLHQFRPVPDVLTTSLGNIGAVFHPTSAILNVGMIESGKTYDYYLDSVTPTVANVIQKVDQERMKIAKAAGAEVFSAQQWLQESYKVKEGPLYNMVVSNSAYQGITGPSTIHNRYIMEDIPTGLVPMEAFAQLFEVSSPTITALITLANSMIERDFRTSGRNLNRLGLNGVSPLEIKSYIYEGIE